MHPIERLRYVARTDGAGPAVLVRETALALCGMEFDPQSLVLACRRIAEMPGLTIGLEGLLGI